MPYKVRRLDDAEVEAREAEFRSVYAEVYHEPPYNEPPEHADDFIQQLADQRTRPGFSMVIAEADDDSLVGFSYGFTFAPDRWWRTDDDEPQLTRGREKFALMELAVLPAWRRRGIGAALMTAILSDRPEPYATLCANPAAPARSIYQSWGWQQVGVSHPAYLGPMDVLVLPLT